MPITFESKKEALEYAKQKQSEGLEVVIRPSKNVFIVYLTGKTKREFIPLEMPEGQKITEQEIEDASKIGLFVDERKQQMDYVPEHIAEAFIKKQQHSNYQIYKNMGFGWIPYHNTVTLEEARRIAKDIETEEEDIKKLDPKKYNIESYLHSSERPVGILIYDTAAGRIVEEKISPPREISNKVIAQIYDPEVGFAFEGWVVEGKNKAEVYRKIEEKLKDFGEEGIPKRRVEIKDLESGKIEDYSLEKFVTPDSFQED